MATDHFTFQPSLLPEEIERRLASLLVPGSLANTTANSELIRLDRTFNRYAAGITHGLWSPGLRITHEMRSVAELFLPLQDIHRAFRLFLGLVMRREAFLGASIIHQATSWLDALHELQPVVKRANPAAVLRDLLADEQKRRVFLFANFLPLHYGGAFNRYPQQMAFLADWLWANRGRLMGDVTCLDAACGCGEGTYELAALLLRAGFPIERVRISGTTIEPFELFASAHAFFPHDRRRQESYRYRLAQLGVAVMFDRVQFSLEDITHASTPGQFDVILCNGILGGPFLHEKLAVGRAIGKLAGRLRRGGLLLAADRFHGGWKKRMPQPMVARLLAESGLRVLEAPEGVAALKLDEDTAPG